MATKTKTKVKHTKSEINDLQIRVNQTKEYASNISDSTSIAFSRMGINPTSQVGTRDYEAVLGYCSTQQNYSTYKYMYDTGDVAKRVVDAPVSAIWASPPSIIETDESADLTQVSALDMQWKKVYRELEIGPSFIRADRMNRLGKFSIVYLGYEDGSKLNTKVKKGSKIKYLQPLSIENVKIASYVNDYRDSRNGLPEFYDIIQFSDLDHGIGESTAPKKEQTTVKVHHSRVLHITDDNLDSNVYSVPVFTHVYNRLVDLIKVVGGSAEMFWLGARPGYAAIAAPETNVTDENFEQIEQMLKAYDDGLSRWLQLQGMSVESLSPQVYSPRDHFDTIIATISAATGIPQRILTGAEAGALASTQDKANWETTIIERRSVFAEPKMLHPLIAKLQESGQLAAGEYEIVWADLTTVSDLDKADAAYKNSQAFMFSTLDPMKLKLIGPKIWGDKIMQLDEQSIREISEGWDATVEELIQRDAEQQKSNDVGSQAKAAVNKGIFDLFKKPGENQ